MSDPVPGGPARLLVALEARCPEHLFVSQANDVQISTRRLFIPDVLVTTFGAAERRSGKFTPPEVVLAVEIVSPSSQSMDRVMKPALYAKAGIPFYWMIEIDHGITVHTYQLGFEDEVYQPSGTFTDAIKIDKRGGSRFRSPVSARATCNRRPRFDPRTRHGQNATLTTAVRTSWANATGTRTSQHSRCS